MWGCLRGRLGCRLRRGSLRRWRWRFDAYVNHGREQLTRKSPQISRFFYYSTRGAPGFDSGLLEAAELPAEAEKVRKKRPAPSTPREIYGIYKQKTLYGH